MAKMNTKDVFISLLQLFFVLKHYIKKTTLSTDLKELIIFSNKNDKLIYGKLPPHHAKDV